MKQTRKIEKVYKPHGPALITPENREALNPFVLFDAGLVKTESKEWGFDWHPHSGVATLTFPFLGDLHHEDSGSNAGVIPEGGFQWMQAGGGIWHKEIYHSKNNLVGVQQLWVRLGPNEELGPNHYFDVHPNNIESIDGTRVFVGEYKGATGKHSVPADITYLDVSLSAGEVWTFNPPASQTRGFIYPRKGFVSVQDTLVQAFNLGKFVDSIDPIEIHAKEDTNFVIAIAKPGEYPLVSQYGQIHTTKEALQKGAENIRTIEKTMGHQENNDQEK